MIQQAKFAYMHELIQISYYLATGITVHIPQEDENVDKILILIHYQNELEW